MREGCSLNITLTLTMCFTNWQIFFQHSAFVYNIVNQFRIGLSQLNNLKLLNITDLFEMRFCHFLVSFWVKFISALSSREILIYLTNSKDFAKTFHDRSYRGSLKPILLSLEHNTSLGRSNGYWTRSKDDKVERRTSSSKYKNNRWSKTSYIGKTKETTHRLFYVYERDEKEQRYSTITRSLCFIRAQEAESVEMHKNLSNLWAAMTKDEKQVQFIHYVLISHFIAKEIHQHGWGG